MNRNKGLTLIEILVAIFIIALIVGPFTGMFLHSTRVRSILSNQLKTIYAVRNEMEKLMVQDSIEIFNSIGIKEIEGIYLRTSVSPYYPDFGTRCFYIMAKNIEPSRDQLIIFTPDGYKTFLFSGDMESYNIELNIEDELYQLNVADHLIAGSIGSTGKACVQINLIDKESSNHMRFFMTGDVETTIYPGNSVNWDIISNNGYNVVDKCFYRDYSMFKVKIEAFKDASLSHSVFKIENIIRASN